MSDFGMRDVSHLAPPAAPPFDDMLDRRQEHEEHRESSSKERQPLPPPAHLSFYTHTHAQTDTVIVSTLHTRTQSTAHYDCTDEQDIRGGLPASHEGSRDGGGEWRGTLVWDDVDDDEHKGTSVDACRRSG